MSSTNSHRLYSWVSPISPNTPYGPWIDDAHPQNCWPFRSLRAAAQIAAMQRAAAELATNLHSWEDVPGGDPIADTTDPNNPAGETPSEDGSASSNESGLPPNWLPRSYGVDTRRVPWTTTLTRNSRPRQEVVAIGAVDIASYRTQSATRFVYASSWQVRWFRLVNSLYENALLQGNVNSDRDFEPTTPRAKAYNDYTYTDDYVPPISWSASATVNDDDDDDDAPQIDAWPWNTRKIWGPPRDVPPRETLTPFKPEWGVIGSGRPGQAQPAPAPASAPTPVPAAAFARAPASAPLIPDTPTPAPKGIRKAWKLPPGL